MLSVRDGGLGVFEGSARQVEFREVLGVGNHGQYLDIFQRKRINTCSQSTVGSLRSLSNICGIRPIPLLLMSLWLHERLLSGNVTVGGSESEVMFYIRCAWWNRKVRKSVGWLLELTILHLLCHDLCSRRSLGRCKELVLKGGRDWEKKRFGPLRARLCALHAQDQLENFTNCPLLIATHSDFLCFNP